MNTIKLSETQKVTLRYIIRNETINKKNTYYYITDQRERKKNR